MCFQAKGVFPKVAKPFLCYRLSACSNKMRITSIVCFMERNGEEWSTNNHNFSGRGDGRVTYAFTQNIESKVVTILAARHLSCCGN